MEKSRKGGVKEVWSSGVAWCWKGAQVDFSVKVATKQKPEEVREEAKAHDCTRVY